MTTLDLAIEHLKDFDFSEFNPYDAESDRKMYHKHISNLLDMFMEDKRNTHSNEVWKANCFTVAFYHLAEKSIKDNSIFDIACVIVEEAKELASAPYLNTRYPKTMFEKFHNYCEKLNPQPYYLEEDSEIRDSFLMVAFHTLTEKV